MPGIFGILDASPASPASDQRELTAILERMAAEGVHFAAQLKSAEAREAFAAFAEKRAPVWRGR